MPNINDPQFERSLEPGEAVRCALGEAGAHQVINRTGETVRFLAMSSHGRPDVVVYPDAGKIGVGERLPRGGGLRAFFRHGDAVDYWEGAAPPSRDELQQ